MINEFISEFPDYDWSIEIEKYYDDTSNEDIYCVLHYTADLSNFMKDIIKVNRKTKKCISFTNKVSPKLGIFLLHYDRDYVVPKEEIKLLHTKAILRRTVNGNTI